MPSQLADLDALEDLLEGLVSIPTVPSTLTEINRILDDPDGSAREAAEVVARDPAVAAKVLRLVNSAYYALKNPVSNIPFAVSILGLKVLKNLVVQATILETFGAKEGAAGLDTEWLWDHSFKAAVAAGQLARHAADTVKMIPEDAYTCGLIHDVGRIIMADSFGAKFARAVLVARKTKKPLQQVEQETFNFDHAAVGALLSERWRLSPRLSKASLHHHSPQALDGEAAGSSGVALILHDATEARQKTFQAIESERIQALTLLAASVAHEIGNPLNALHIHLQLMDRELRKLARLESELNSLKPGRSALAKSGLSTLARDLVGHTDRLRNYLDVAKGEIGRLDYIVTQFLQAIRPSPPQKKATSLNQVVDQTLDLLRPEIENRGQLIEKRLETGLPRVPLDPVQIQQALVNLIKNAMQAMTRGGTLGIQTGTTARGVWVSVSDTGHGISADQLNRIFEPFFTTKKKGSGLGLMIVQRIVREHGGLIKLESHAERGTTFRIWLPLEERQPRLLEARLHD